MSHAGEFPPPKLYLGSSPPNLGSSPPRKSSPTLSFDQLPTLCQAAWTRWKWGFIGLFLPRRLKKWWFGVIWRFRQSSAGHGVHPVQIEIWSKSYPYIFLHTRYVRCNWDWQKLDNIISSTCHCQSVWPDFFDILQNWWESASGENFLLHWFWSNFKTGFTGNIAQPLSFQSLRDW